LLPWPPRAGLMRLAVEQVPTKWRHERGRCMESWLNDAPLSLWLLHMLDDSNNSPLVLMLHWHDSLDHAPQFVYSCIPKHCCQEQQ
jgi:hypothetical protein